jgi:menaquinol-cytochrome c reductase iron-sulfur subunit
LESCELPERLTSPTTEAHAPREALLARRRFLARVSIALGALATAVISVPIIAYLLSPIIRPPANVWRDVARLDDLTVGETVIRDLDEPSPLPWAGQTARTAIWLRRTGERDFMAFGVSCTHLGCPVNWRSQAQLFLCPCHGGVYYANGEVAGGPPPRPLVQYSVRVFGTSVQVLTQPLTFSQA